ncbi:MAG: amidohydrolase family protein [Candidatus Bathyarchaeia archaeon]|jgi:aminocarboxymuconate-semialdehyde decarboxylase
MIIDFHSHYFPKEYIKELDNGGPYLRRVPKPILKELWDIETRFKDPERKGIDVEVISLSNPMLDFVTRKKAPELAKIVNNDIAEVVRKYDGKFVGIAALPFTNMPFVLEELDRAVKDLDLRGVSVCTHVAGRSINEPEFWPFWKRVNELDVPVLLHPESPFGMEWGKMNEYTLTLFVGFPFETTLTVAKLMLSGIFEQYPNLKVFAPHGGGALPYLIGRLDTGYKAYSYVREDAPNPPSSYLKNVYIDGITFYKQPFALAYQTLGANNMVFGTDYPYRIGTTADLVGIIKNAEMPENEKEKIFNQNAKRLLRVK